MVGRFAGALIMRWISPSRILAFNCVVAGALIVTSIVATGPLAMWAILLVGLCNSIMFPIIFTIAICGLGPLTGRGSAALVMAICGGALVPIVQGAFADRFGIALSFCAPLVCYFYILHFARRSYKSEMEPAQQL